MPTWGVSKKKKKKKKQLVIREELKLLPTDRASTNVRKLLN